jgi:SnoaL-like domain
MSDFARELVKARQPTPATDLVQLFADDAAWELFTEAAGDAFEPGFQCAAVGTPQGDMEENGFEGLRVLWTDWLSPWRSYRTSVDKVLEVGEKVVVWVHDWGVGPDSDVEIAIRPASVWTVQEGRVVRVEFHTSRDSAMRSARS